LSTEETTYEQTADDINNSDIRQVIEGDYNGESEAESNTQEER